jgi:formyltetrahydrofolate-dependent phosphoribosylglycinamide formyltransferase
MAQDEKKLRIGVLLSGGGRTMLNLLDQIRGRALNAEIVTVIASRPCKGIERAKAAGLDVHLVPRKETDSVSFSARIAERLDAADVELVCMAGFLSLWTVPDKYAGRVMNIHPALLPLFGGRGFYGDRVHAAVLESGMKVSGCTVHFVTNEYDAGPIIVQRTVPVEEGDTIDALAARVFVQECVAYPAAIRLYAAGRLEIDGRVVHVRPE